ncbi:MAG: hypothetical protein IJC38_09950 [Erysipelotrichaceae bacterium]|nr:hypothetical protein [Erysipelotrichaceae bacterium]
MKILESFTLSKRNNGMNEDCLYIGNRIIAVIDGVTSKSPQPQNVEKTGGCFAAETISRLFDAMPENLINPLDIVIYLNHHLKCLIADSPYAAQKEPPAASVIFYDKNTRCVISYGDCQFLYQGLCYKDEKKIDIIHAEKRARILQECLSQGYSEQELLMNDFGRKEIEPEILNSFLEYANQKKEYGFAVLGFAEVVPEFIRVYPVNEGEELILASDGYPFLCSTLKDSEKALNELIQKDPLLIHEVKSTKGLQKDSVSFDDRTYVKFIA